MASGTCPERTFPEGRREPILVDITHATRLLSLSKSYLYRETKAGNIPHVKIGSRILFRISDLDAWIDSQPSASRESRCA